MCSAIPQHLFLPLSHCPSSAALKFCIPQLHQPTPNLRKDEMEMNFRSVFYRAGAGDDDDDDCCNLLA